MCIRCVLGGDGGNQLVLQVPITQLMYQSSEPRWQCAFIIVPVSVQPPVRVPQGGQVPTPQSGGVPWWGRCLA